MLQKQRIIYHRWIM